MKRCICCVILFLIVAKPVFSQCKTYRLDAKHDTLNCTDFHDLKQGKWLTRVENNHGEPGYQEEGVYKDSKKVGAWTSFNLMGDVIAEENYKWDTKMECAVTII